MADYVHVNPAWAGTLRLAIPGAAHDITPVDVGALFAVAGELADRDPCRTGGGYDHDLARERLDAMVAGAEVPRIQVDLTVPDLMRRLALRRSAILDSTAIRLRGMTNDGAALFDAVEVRDKALRCTVANSPALLTAHRCYGRPMHGRRGNGVSTHAYVGLSPRAAASFASAASAVIHARLQCWLLAPGAAGMPESRATVDEATGTVTLRLRHADLPRYLGLWTTRLRPSAVRVLLERVEADLANAGYWFHAMWSADGDECIVRFRRDRDVVPEQPNEETNFLGIQEGPSPRKGRRAPMRSDERKARDAVIAEAHDVAGMPPAILPAPAGRSPSPARPRRMGATLAEAMPATSAEPVTTSAIPHEINVELDGATPEPEPPAAAEPEPPVATPTVEQAPTVAVEPEAGEVEGADHDREPPPPYPRDGWGWRRDVEGEGQVYDGSEELARLDNGVVPAFVPRSSVDVINGPVFGDDVRPAWLTRYMRYRISWWLGAWADRPVSAHPPLPRTRIAPMAVWCPGMGAQPAHVFTLDDIERFRDRAERRAMWIPVREEVERLQELGVDVDEDVPLDLTMRKVDYPRLDAEFGRDGMEPWDADRVVPHLLPGDKAACDEEVARRETRKAAARAAREARRAALAA